MKYLASVLVKGPIMLIDGECAFCSGAMRFVIRNEDKPVIRFASLQSKIGRDISRRYSLPTTGFKSFVIVRDGLPYTRFEAVLQLADLMGGRWRKLGRVLGMVVPTRLGNATYSLLWPMRKVFGRQDMCSLPSEEVRMRLLDSQT